MALEGCQPMCSRVRGSGSGSGRQCSVPITAVPWMPVCLLLFLGLFLHSLHFPSKGHNEEKYLFEEKGL